MKRNRPTWLGLQSGILAGLLILGIGCKKQPSGVAEQPAPASSETALPVQPAPPPPAPPDDRQISQDVHARIKAETALDGQRIHVAVSGGVVTLSGKATDEASRALAAADSGAVNGVRTVINNLVVAPPAIPAKAASLPRPPRKAYAEVTPPPPPLVQPAPPPPAEEAVQTVPPAPTAPPPPVVKTVTLPAGTVIPVRMTDTLQSASTQTNSTFHGSLATDLIVNGMVAVPRGANIVGRVILAKDATHFSGSSELSLELTSILANGQEYSVVTNPYTKQGAARGKNTALKTGGGAALGAILGAIAGGGRGAAIGAAAGGGAGAGVNGVTRGQQVEIPTESLVNFTLQSPLAVTTSRKAGGAGFNQDQGPQLQQPQ